MRFPSHWLRRNYASYLLALAGMLIATLCRYALGPTVGGAIPVVIYTVPVTLAALYGGFWPGLFCTLISALMGDYLFIEPIYSFVPARQAGVVSLLVFLAIGLTISYFGQRMRELRTKLQQQTVDVLEANCQLAQANARKDEFLAMLAHELRNPLAGISTAAELLKFTHADQQRIAQTGDVITRQVRHMTKLIDDILDVSRVTRGLLMIEKNPVDVRDVLAAAIEQVQASLESKQQHLTINTPQTAACVCGDRTRLTQVISNLLANANKYSPARSSIHVEIRSTQTDVELSVKDNGQGIDQAFLPKIFDLFVQAESSSSQSQGGLGIGLALVKKIVELHRGTIWAESGGPGKGSQFTIVLPRYHNSIQPSPPDQLRSAQPARPMCILVVDDNQDAANTLALLLEASGHTVFVEYTAKGALDCAHAEELDAVILDIGLPERDGWELCRQMKTIPHLANAAFIAVSGYKRETDVRMSKEVGFDAHFAKPVQLPELFSALAEKHRL